METTHRISRQALIEHVTATFRADPSALAAWLGGSDASGRTDAYSDVDFQIVVDPEHVESAFDSLHRCLSELGPILHSHRVPEPTWHGFSQEFLLVEGCSPHHFLDFAVIPSSTPPAKRMLEIERHGNPLVLFDSVDWLVDLPTVNWETWAPKMRARLEVLRNTFPLYQTLVTRSVQRGLGVEAVGFYQAFSLKPLVELLRMRHAPERYDFGLRYLDRDLPAGTRELLEELAFPADLQQCERFRERCEERFDLELRDMDQGLWSIEC